LLTGPDHFAHRKTGGLVVDLFWWRTESGAEFRVVVTDENAGGRFVLRPRSGREAIQAFYRPPVAPSLARAAV
jgi:hypothetical protein